MTATRSVRLLTAAFLLAGAALVLMLAVTLVLHVAGGARSGLWLFAWVTAFAVLVPVGAVVVAVLAPIIPVRSIRIVPNAGWKIPRAGQ